MTGSGSGASRDDSDSRGEADRPDSFADGEQSRALDDEAASAPREDPASGGADDGRPSTADGSVTSTRTDGEGSVSIEEDGILRWFLKSDDGGVVYVRDIVTSVGLVVLIALILFGISGVWPPLVAVESGSMEPNMERGDMIFVVADDRFVGDGAAADTGIVTHETGAETGYTTFGEAGDVIIFQPDGDDRETPVIHRAYFWVEEGDYWVDERADPSLTNGKTCDQVRACPAPYDGFVTRGDANGGYDQVGMGADTNVVKDEWVEGKAHVRIPWLGYIRLTVDELLLAGPGGTGVGAVAGLFGMATAAAMFRPTRRP